MEVVASKKRDFFRQPNGGLSLSNKCCKVMMLSPSKMVAKPYQKW